MTCYADIIVNILLFFFLGLMHIAGADHDWVLIKFGMSCVS